MKKEGIFSMNSLESFAKYVPSTSNVTLNPMGSSTTILTDMEAKSRRYISSLNDVLYDTSNEPSLGFYRVQEHVRKTIPSLVAKNTELENFHARVKGAIFDLNYSLDVVSKMSQADQTLENVKNLLTDSLYLARQLSMRNSKPHETHNSNLGSKQTQR